MRVAFFVARFPVLSETFIVNQITGLIDRGHSVTIYANRPGNTARVHPEVESYGLLARTRFLLDGPAGFARRHSAALAANAVCICTRPNAFLRDLRARGPARLRLPPNVAYSAIPFLPRRSFDVLYCHFGPQGRTVQRLRDLGVLKGPLVTVFHGSDITRYVQRHGAHIYDDLFRSGDLFLPISENWKNKAATLGCKPQKLRVHHMGIDLDKFPFVSRTKARDEDVRIMTVANHVEKKGLEYSIRAVAKAAARCPHLHYDIIGDGPRRPALEALITDLGISARVKLLGAQAHDEVRRAFARSHLFVLSSVTADDGDQEGIPVVLMEAMAMGLPVISTRHSGIPELVADGVSGYLVPERDVDALADRLADLIEHPDRWPEMGKAGRTIVEENFDLKKLNDRLADLFRELVARQNS